MTIKLITDNELALLDKILAQGGGGETAVPGLRERLRLSEKCIDKIDGCGFGYAGVLQIIEAYRTATKGDK